ncbi:MAG: hypothetical protein LBR30_00465 [Clostridioides sp.]|nr:hypothetical protein [Clostridioides sp.]
MNKKLLIGEINAVLSNIKPSDIPLAIGIDIDKLKSSDDDPLEVVVEIPASKSKLKIRT